MLTPSDLPSPDPPPLPDALTPLLALVGQLTGADQLSVALTSGAHAWEAHWPRPPHPSLGEATHGWDFGSTLGNGVLQLWAPSLGSFDPAPVLACLTQFLNQHAAQGELHEAHAQLQAIVHSAPLAVYALTLGGLVKQWNRAAEHTFGLTRDEVLGQPIGDARLDGAFTALRRSLTQGRAARTPQLVTVTQPDAGDVELALLAAPLADGLVGTAHRVSPPERDLQRTQQQLSLLESVLAHANDSVLITEAEPFDQPGPRVVYANAAFTRTTGYSLEEILGQTPRILHGPRTDRKALDKIRHALERWQSVEVEVVNYRKDGSEFWVELSIAPVADETGWYTHWISIQRDITDRKQFADHLDRERSQVLELAAQNAPLSRVLARLLHTLERQFEGWRGALMLPSEPPDCFTAHGDGDPQRAAWLQAAALAEGTRAPEALSTPAASTVWRHPVQSGAALLGTFVLVGPAEPPNADERTQLMAAGQLAALVIERYEAHATLERQALYDALTSLPNRVLFERELGRQLREARRSGRGAAIGLIDLDRFKQINDSLGHSVGDALLQQVAVRLRSVLSSQDTLARMGGDEFLLVLAQVSSEHEVRMAAERLIGAFSQPFVLSGREVFVRPSLGFTLFPQAATMVEALLQQADTAMYQAKRRGGGFALYVPEGEGQLAAMTLESALHRALHREEFVLHYQPQYDLGSGRLVGVEALLRWQHPELGLVPPGDFIPLAEVTGLIVPIGAWVLRQACHQAMAWSARTPGLKVAVNLSARQFQQPELIETVAWALQTSGLPAHRLVLELTESMLMQPMEANDTLQRLKALGVQVAVDDFGTGYSNLAYLKQYPIDALKIDRSFTSGVASGLPSSGRDEALISAVMNLAHALNLEVTVEGVETQGQLEFLRHYGNSQVQGYFTGRPEEAGNFARILQRLDCPPSSLRNPEASAPHGGL